MNKVMFGILVLIFVSLFSGVDAASSSTLVNFIIGFNNSESGVFGGFVDDLRVDDRDMASIEWTWENSEDGDFNYNLIFFNMVLVYNGTNEFFDAEGLNSDECYEIFIVSVGENGSEGPLVAGVACTLDEEDEEDEKVVRKSSRGSGMKDDVIPNFFVSDDEVLIGEVVIVLESSVAVEDCDWLVLACWILSLLIFVLLAFILGFGFR